MQYAEKGEMMQTKTKTCMVLVAVTALSLGSFLLAADPALTVITLDELH